MNALCLNRFMRLQEAKTVLAFRGVGKNDTPKSSFFYRCTEIIRLVTGVVSAGQCYKSIK